MQSWWEGFTVLLNSHQTPIGFLSNFFNFQTSGSKSRTFFADSSLQLVRKLGYDIIQPFSWIGRMRLAGGKQWTIAVFSTAPWLSKWILIPEKNSMITSVITTYERRLLWPRSKGIYIIGSFIWMAGISTAQTKLLLPIMETRYWIGFILTEILMAKALDCFFHNSFTHCTFHRLFYMQSNRGVLDFTMCTLSDAYNILDVAIWDYWMLTHKKHLTYSFKNRPLS